MIYDDTQGERMVDDSRRCLLQSNCLLFQFAMRLSPADLPKSQATFYCPNAARLFRAALGPDPMLEFVLSQMSALQYCYAIDEQGDFTDGTTQTFLRETKNET
jgi:hypothetical protein